MGIWGGKLGASDSEVGGGRTVAVRAGRSVMHAIFSRRVEGSDPYAVDMAVVRGEMSAPRAWHLSKSVLTITVRFRSIRPVI